MNKILKAGILVVLLLIPVFIFLFLKVFGKNRYDLPYLHPVAVNYTETGKPDTVFLRLRDTLFTSSGSEIKFKFNTGEIKVVGFIKEEPILKELEAIQDEFIRNNNLVIYSFADLDRERIAIHAQNYHVDPTKWKFFNPDQELDAIGQYIKLRPEEIRKYLVLIDEKGFIRGNYKFSDPKEIERLILEIRILMHENKNNAAAKD
jgi:protein SCO1